MCKIDSQAWQQGQHQPQTLTLFSQLGTQVIDALAPQPQETILDLGCGDGQLSHQIEQYGAKVVGVDNNLAMVEAACEKGIEVFHQDGQSLNFQSQFDAVFSHASLHFMPNYHAALSGVYRSLKPGGRFVGELGGVGNLAVVEDAIRAFFTLNPGLGQYQSPWFFPTQEQFYQLLVAHGFIVERCELLARPTLIKAGMRAWLNVFASDALVLIPVPDREAFLDQIEAMLKPQLYSPTLGWQADYMRIRFIAYKK
ncbi:MULTISPECIES: class I SAM-dependent methyltransferase [unclassified Vibrio]|uniref:Class I SAM-dependent methyltransferase n=1 Tax=Vibrio sp. HB236076 TaxID=3232307 RepID=A0AB39HAE3_9VIBR|nr:class I SAM-dependent methyltransferase [Vibrio sp. HB161653]MDP5253481.1 methyltransferase domain-containing protein [Vibrio sp. HB161653]